ncbi:hypothetical protein QBC39DRAFT_9394 [Podospora conica]|nr:hypothetical protein QBC39DRAFT_9394 [Schizothecium conicum]
MTRMPSCQTRFQPGNQAERAAEGGGGMSRRVLEDKVASGGWSRGFIAGDAVYIGSGAGLGRVPECPQRGVRGVVGVVGVVGVARRRCKVEVGGVQQQRPGKEETLVILSIKRKQARWVLAAGSSWVMGNGNGQWAMGKSKGIGGWVLEGRVMCAFLLPVCFFFIRYLCEGADKRRQQWMIHEPAGRGRSERGRSRVWSRSSSAAKIQNARKPEIPKMPEWLERPMCQRAREKRIKSKTSAVCGTKFPTLARCWLRIIIATHLPNAWAKRYRRIFFSLSLSSSSASFHLEAGASSKSRLRSVLFPCDACPHTPPPPHVQLGKMAVRVFDPIHPLTTAHGPA